MSFQKIFMIRSSIDYSKIDIRKGNFEFWDRLINKLNSNPEKALKMAKKINDLAGYSRVAKVNTGLTYVKDIDAKIEEYAKLFGYSTFEISGTHDIFEKCYLSIKKEIVNTV
jgi:hypothetical protein